MLTNARAGVGALFASAVTSLLTSSIAASVEGRTPIPAPIETSAHAGDDAAAVVRPAGDGRSVDQPPIAAGELPESLSRAHACSATPGAPAGTNTLLPEQCSNLDAVHNMPDEAGGSRQARASASGTKQHDPAETDGAEQLSLTSTAPQTGSTQQSATFSAVLAEELDELPRACSGTPDELASQNVTSCQKVAVHDSLMAATIPAPTQVASSPRMPPPPAQQALHGTEGDACKLVAGSGAPLPDEKPVSHHVVARSEVSDDVADLAAATELLPPRPPTPSSEDKPRISLPATLIMHQPVPAPRDAVDGTHLPLSAAAPGAMSLTTDWGALSTFHRTDAGSSTVGGLSVSALDNLEQQWERMVTEAVACAGDTDTACEPQTREACIDSVAAHQVEEACALTEDGYVTCTIPHDGESGAPTCAPALHSSSSALQQHAVDASGLAETASAVGPAPLGDQDHSVHTRVLCVGGGSKQCHDRDLELHAAVCSLAPLPSGEPDLDSACHVDACDQASPEAPNLERVDAQAQATPAASDAPVARQCAQQEHTRTVELPGGCATGGDTSMPNSSYALRMASLVDSAPGTRYVCLHPESEPECTVAGFRYVPGGVLWPKRWRHALDGDYRYAIEPKQLEHTAVRLVHEHAAQLVAMVRPLPPACEAHGDAPSPFLDDFPMLLGCLLLCIFGCPNIFRSTECHATASQCGVRVSPLFASAGCNVTRRHASRAPSIDALQSVSSFDDLLRTFQPVWGCGIDQCAPEHVVMRVLTQVPCQEQHTATLGAMPMLELVRMYRRIAASATLGYNARALGSMPLHAYPLDALLLEGSLSVRRMQAPVHETDRAQPATACGGGGDDDAQAFSPHRLRWHVGALLAQGDSAPSLSLHTENTPVDTTRCFFSLDVGQRWQYVYSLPHPQDDVLPGCHHLELHALGLPAERLSAAQAMHPAVAALRAQWQGCKLPAKRPRKSCALPGDIFEREWAMEEDAVVGSSPLFHTARSAFAHPPRTGTEAHACRHQADELQHHSGAQMQRMLPESSLRVPPASTHFLQPFSTVPLTLYDLSAPVYNPMSGYPAAAGAQVVCKAAPYFSWTNIASPPALRPGATTVLDASSAAMGIASPLHAVDTPIQTTAPRVRGVSSADAFPLSTVNNVPHPRKLTSHPEVVSTRASADTISSASTKGGNERRMCLLQPDEALVRLLSFS